MSRPAAWTLAALVGIATVVAVVATSAPVAPAGGAAGASTTALPAPAPDALGGDRWPAAAPTPEQVLYDQPRQLDAAFARLRARTPGKVNLYAIAFAGDGSQRVFRNEAEYFARLFGTRFAAAGHVVVLENSQATLASRPLATWTNLEETLDAVARKMDPDRDILLLYLTTHGNPDHTLLVDMDPLPLDQIGAQDLAGILAEHPFKYKIVVVNACYSGGFIPPLRGPGTLVVTAARGDRSSFGCGEQSELTWFGHAFLVDALNRDTDFRKAFADARREVASWEQRDNFEPSEPQISVGAGITAQLARWRKGFVPGPAVPFAPASSVAPRP